MLERAERASHIDPPASSYAIMQRASPYCGENPGPGKDVYGELDPTLGIREQPGSFSTDRPARAACGMSASLRSRPSFGVATKRRVVPWPDSCTATKKVVIRSPRRRGQGAAATQ